MRFPPVKKPRKMLIALYDHLIRVNVGSLGRYVRVRGRPHVGVGAVRPVRARSVAVGATAAPRLAAAVSALAQTHAAASSLPYYTAKGNIILERMHIVFLDVKLTWKLIIINRSVLGSHLIIIKELQFRNINLSAF